MKKPKIVRYKNKVITIALDGQLYDYFVDRPQPLTSVDATMLRNVLDTTMFEALLNPIRPKRNPLSWLAELYSGVWGHKNVVPYPYGAIANYIERVGVEIDVGKAKALVIPRSDVDKIRKGGVI